MKWFTDSDKKRARKIARVFKYIARNKFGEIWVYEEVPLKGTCMWHSGNKYLGVDKLGSCKNMFESIEWADEKAIFIDDIILNTFLANTKESR